MSVSLSDVISVYDLDEDNELDNMSLSDLELKNNSYFVKFPSMPVNLCLMEYMKYTLDDLLDNDYDMSTTEWFGILFQVLFGLSVAQKHYQFVHNDLHSSNIMFQSTKEQYLYFCIDKIYYKIPLFNKITKIIDFARGTFKFKNRYIFSDVFHDEGEAAGQYSYPKGPTLHDCQHRPNPSFDLVRLATTIIERLEDEPEVLQMVQEWTRNDDGIYIIDDDDDFDLYVEIAQNCHNAIPIKLLKECDEFNMFRIKQNEIPNNKFIFYY